MDDTALPRYADINRYVPYYPSLGHLSLGYGCPCAIISVKSLPALQKGPETSPATMGRRLEPGGSTQAPGPRVGPTLESAIFLAFGGTGCTYSDHCSIMLYPGWQPSAFWDMIGDPGVAARERNNLPLAYSGGGLSQPTPESHWMDG